MTAQRVAVRHSERLYIYISGSTFLRVFRFATAHRLITLAARHVEELAHRPDEVDNSPEDDRRDRNEELLDVARPDVKKAPLEDFLFDTFLASAEEIVPRYPPTIPEFSMEIRDTNMECSFVLKRINCGEIRLWLSGRAAAHNEALIDSMGVSHVLCVGSHLGQFYT